MKIAWKIDEEIKTNVLNDKGKLVADCDIFLPLRSEEENLNNAKLIASCFLNC